MLKVGDVVECVAINISSERDRIDFAKGIQKQPLEVGKVYEVVRSFSSSGFDWVDVVGNGVQVSGTYATQFKRTNKINVMGTVKTLIKKITRVEPEKTFVKVGFLDENDEITTDGRSALEYILWNANKDALKALADKISANGTDTSRN